MVTHNHKHSTQKCGINKKAKHSTNQKEGKIVAIQYSRRVCKLLSGAYQDLCAIKQDVGAKALDTCTKARDTLINNNAEREIIRRLVAKKDKEASSATTT